MQGAACNSCAHLEQLSLNRLRDLLGECSDLTPRVRCIDVIQRVMCPPLHLVHRISFPLQFFLQHAVDDGLGLLRLEPLPELRGNMT